MPKPARRNHLNSPKSNWQCYSTAIGVNPHRRIGADNQARIIRGFAIDYDSVQTVDQVLKALNSAKLGDENCPQFIEITLSDKVRLVWVFSRDVLTTGNDHYIAIFTEFVRKFDLEHVLAGYDPASQKPTQLWTNGGQWFTVRTTPFSDRSLLGILTGASKRVSAYAEETIPLSVIWAKMEEMFKGRWQGEFKIDALGVRFWDPAADCPTGCQVKPDGMLCFTGTQPFVKWEEIFTKAWCDEQRVLNLGKAAEGIYFDGKMYWEKGKTLWEPKSRVDAVLELRNRGLSDKTPKGEKLSMVDKVLHTIQKQNRVVAAAPLINLAPGVVTYEGRTFLNIADLQFPAMLRKEDITGKPEVDFPWIWSFLNGLFKLPGRQPLQYFLAWLQRANRALRTHKNLMGQVLFFCGPRHNGKSLLSTRIIAPLLGNRQTNPWDWLVGRTSFSDNLFESSLLAVNDEEAPRSFAEQQSCNAKIKSLSANTHQQYHPKFRERVTIPWNGRVCVTLNDDPSSLAILPEVNANTEDKMMFFATQPYRGIWGSNEEIEGTIHNELPKLQTYLEYFHQPPPEILENSRMVVKSYFDPQVLEWARTQAKEYNLLEIIRRWQETDVYWVGDAANQPHEVWEGTAIHLRGMLTTCPETQDATRQLKINDMPKALTGLTKLAASGVKFAEGGVGRVYQITYPDIVSP